jgi:cation:H+ antiporter
MIEAGNMLVAVLFVAAGLVLLWKAADILVGGAVALAQGLGVSSLVIGLTIVAMGTSAPEVATSIVAAAKGAGDIAIGNVYGSNIANLALVGGVAALICPIVISGRILRRELPVMVIVAILLWPMIGNAYLSRFEGILLLLMFSSLIILAIHAARKEGAGEKPKETSNQMKRGRSVLYILLGLAGLVIGAKLTVEGAVFIGRQIGLSEAVIGLTIIAVGTSLPELATCVVAAMKGHNDISIGNLVGSNIFNTLLVTGTAGVIRPFEIAERLAGIDYFVMVGITAVFAMMALFGKRIGRVNAAILLGGYICYICYALA